MPPVSPGLDQLRVAVLDQPELQARLLAHDDPKTFAAAVVGLSGELGFDVSEADVDRAIGEARRAWFERWI
jgi:hypothetical protein